MKAPPTSPNCRLFTSRLQLLFPVQHGQPLFAHPGKLGMFFLETGSDGGRPSLSKFLNWPFCMMRKSRWDRLPAGHTHQTMVLPISTCSPDARTSWTSGDTSFRSHWNGRCAPCCRRRLCGRRKPLVHSDGLYGCANRCAVIGAQVRAVVFRIGWKRDWLKCDVTGAPNFSGDLRKAF